MVGLQGSGKTTSTAKIAKRLLEQKGKRVLMASLDVRRPAAQQQLAILGEQVGVKTLPIVIGEPPVAIAKRALQMGRLEGFDVVMLDTAGRLAIDEELMAEVAEVHAAAKPHETLLVADAMTGQDAVTVAKSFKERVNVTGIVLTRVDGDARGGAALVHARDHRLPDQADRRRRKDGGAGGFPRRPHRRPHPRHGRHRQPGREGDRDHRGRRGRAPRQEDAEGRVRPERPRQPTRQLQKMGGLASIAGMLPGIGKMQKQLEGRVDDKVIRRSLAIISSMTPKERRNPDLIKASRKNRIAKGAGMQVQDINKLLKQHMEMARMMKQVSKLGQKGLMRSGMAALMKGGAGGGRHGRRFPPFGGRR